jgi:hypothetical protein
MLHAKRLAFDHPVTGARVELSSELPEDFAAVLHDLPDDLTIRFATANDCPVISS